MCCWKVFPSLTKWWYTLALKDADGVCLSVCFSFTARDTACVIQMWCSSFTTLTPFSSWPSPWSSSTRTCTRPTLNLSVKWASMTSFATWEVCAPLLIHLHTSSAAVWYPGWYSRCDHSKNKYTTAWVLSLWSHRRSAITKTKKKKKNEISRQGAVLQQALSYQTHHQDFEWQPLEKWKKLLKKKKKKKQRICAARQRRDILDSIFCPSDRGSLPFNWSSVTISSNDMSRRQTYEPRRCFFSPPWHLWASTHGHSYSKLK